MAKRIGKYKISKRESEFSMADGGTVKGSLTLTDTVTSNYIDFLAGYQGNLTETGVAITDAEADTAGGSAPGAAGIGAVTVSGSALNTFAGDSGAVAAMYLPKAHVDSHLAIRFTGDMDEANGLTIHASGSALANGSGEGAAAGTVFAKQVIGPLGAGISVISAGTATTPTSNKIIYTPAATATNCIQAGSVWHFYSPKEDVWLVRIFNVPETTGVTGTFTVA